MKAKTKQTNSPNPMGLTPTQLLSRQNQLKIIDVRGWLEYVMGHIPSAERFNRSQILKTVPKDQPIAVTCLSGQRSAIAAQWLIKQGYSKVYNLQGGLLAWQSAGLPVKRGMTR